MLETHANPQVRNIMTTKNAATIGPIGCVQYPQGVPIIFTYLHPVLPSTVALLQ